MAKSDKLHEAIHEEGEREGGGFLRAIALTTAILTALAAIAALQAGATVDRALVLKTKATRLQAEAIALARRIILAHGGSLERIALPATAVRTPERRH
jgi:hypothetical protein